MKKELAQRWSQALRSKKFTQTTGRLRRENGEDKFCVLGVLWELAREDGVAQRRLDGGYYDRLRHYSTSGWTDELLDWAGLSPRSADYLISLNDRGRDFDQLAFVIEGGGV